MFDSIGTFDRAQQHESGRHPLVYQCRECRRSVKFPPGMDAEAVRQFLNRFPHCGKEKKPDVFPGIATRIARYGTAVSRWILAGSPTRSDEEVQQIFERHCRPCEHFHRERQGCRICGCRVAKTGPALKNKIKMATEACPAEPPRWTAKPLQGEGLAIWVYGYPHDVGGAGPHLWSSVRVWRSVGIDVHLVTGNPNALWKQRLDSIGAVTHRASESLDLSGHVVAAFCSKGFISNSARALKAQGAKIVWVGCMSHLFPEERQFYEEVGPFDAAIVNSRFQESVLRPELDQCGYRPEQIIHIPSAFWQDEFECRPRLHLPSDPLVIGRISRHDPEKFDANLWRMYGKIRDALGGHLHARVLGWNDKVEAKCGPPPPWAEALPERAETTERFLASLHVLVHRNGGAQENRPRTCLEAMASGVPVVAEDVHGWPELIEDGKTGFLCRDEDEFVARTVELGRNETRRLQMCLDARNSLGKVTDLPAIGQSWTGLLQQLGAKSAAEVKSDALVRVAGIMAIGPSGAAGVNPRWEHCLRSLAGYVDRVHLRIDSHSLPAEQVSAIAERAQQILVGKPIQILKGTAPWNRWNWREELIRSLDEIKPQFVLFPDCDEELPASVLEELKRLTADTPALQFGYRMVADTDVPVYPPHNHMKAYLWNPGLTYQKYKGFAAVSDYANKRCHIRAKDPVLHYCYETAELRKARGL